MNTKFGRNMVATLVILLVGGLYWFGWRTGSLNARANIHIDFNEINEKHDIVPVVVIGSGPAGLSAALYTSRAALYTVVFQGKTPGGQLTTTSYVENWPGIQRTLGSDIIDNLRKQAEQFGAMMVNDSIECLDFSSWPYRLKLQDGHEINAMTVIIATGANPKRLNIPGEDEYWGKGVTTCAICDAPFYKGKKVVVIGGGDSAIEEATLLASQAKKVTLLVRKAEMKAAPAMQRRLLNIDNISVIYNVGVNKIVGNEDHVTGVELEYLDTKKTELLETDGVFLAIGHTPNTQGFKDFIKTDEAGYLILEGRTQRTSLPGVFAAGDVNDKQYRQAGVAAGAGIMAGLDAVAFLQEHGFNDEYARELSRHYYDVEQDTEKVEIPAVKTNQEFDLFNKGSRPLIVEVGAEYCPSCKVLKEVVKSAAAKFKDTARFAYIDVEEAPELAKRFELQAIPVLLIFKDGKLFARYDQHVFTKPELYRVITELIEKTEINDVSAD